MPKITKCIGEGQGSCKRCNDKGKWNRTWMCFLNKIEGYEGCYCNDCTKEIVKECEQNGTEEQNLYLPSNHSQAIDEAPVVYEVKISNRANLQDHIMSLIPDTIDTDAGTHIYLTYQERLKIAEAIAAGFIKPIEYYNLSIKEFVDKLATIDMPYTVLEQIRELAGMNNGKAQ